MSQTAIGIAPADQTHCALDHSDFPKSSSLFALTLFGIRRWARQIVAGFIAVEVTASDPSPEQIGMNSELMFAAYVCDFPIMGAQS